MIVPNIIDPGSGAGVLSGLLEGMGIPWPGAVILAALGADAHSSLGTLLAGTWFAIAYTAGSVLQYSLGRYFRHLLRHLVSEKQEARLDRLIQRYGQAAVLWTRPLAVGNYISIPAGMMRMPMGKFLLFTFSGIWPWAVAMAFAGSYLASELALMGQLLPYAAAVLAIAGLWPVLRRVRIRARRWSRSWSKKSEKSVAFTD